VKRSHTFIGLGISIIFLALAFRKSDFGQIMEQLRGLDAGPLLLSLPLLFLAFWIRVIRWRYLLLPLGKIKRHTLFGAIMIGFMSLNLLPFRLGEFVRAFVLGRRTNLSKSSVFATIIVERMFDGFAMIFIMLTSLSFLPFSLGESTLDWVRFFAYLGLIVFLLALVLVILIRLKYNVIIRLVEKSPFLSPKIRLKVVRVIRSFAAGLSIIGGFRRFLTITFWSLLVWVVTSVYYWTVMFSFVGPDNGSLGSEAGFAGSLFLTGALALGIMIPAGPAFIGTFELACIAALAALGIAAPVAESYALVLHAAQFFPITLTGLLYLYFQEFNLREIRVGGKETQEGVREAES
jgi:uncharacterized protein (TIRG00374 family)